MAPVPAGWPCALLATIPPSVDDRQSAPSADDLLPQVLALTPRGAAWGTDEASDGQGASPVMLQFWRAVATWVGDVNRRDFELATQVFPSAITWSLPGWEREYGLPESCSAPGQTTAARVAAVRTKFAAVGAQSPDYFVCVAAALGYTITIEEPTCFTIDESEIVGGDPLETWFQVDDGELDADSVVETWFLIDEGEIEGDPLEGFVLAPSQGGTPLEAILFSGSDAPGDELGLDLVERFFTIDESELGGDGLHTVDNDPDGDVESYWVVHVASFGDTWFRIDEGEIDADPLEGFLPATDLECRLRSLCPPHTGLVFNYGGAA